MNIDEAINGWTFEETIKNAESLMEVEKNMFKWDVTRHLRDFAEKYREQSKEYQQLEEQGRLIKLPCKVGDTVYVDATILPVDNMECYEDIDREVPAYFQARVVSFRFAKRNWMKIAVREKWFHEWIDDETGPDSNYIECEKNFTILLSGIGKKVFLTKSEAEAKLKELRRNND